MPRVCLVCIHEKREEIDRDIVSGAGWIALAEKYNVSHDALQRHARNHIPEALLQAQHIADVAHAGSLLDQLQGLMTEARNIKAKAELVNDYRTALSGVRELVRILELIAKLTSQLPTAPVTNILITSPEYLNMRTRVLSALEPFPDARIAVAEALHARNEPELGT